MGIWAGINTSNTKHGTGSNGTGPPGRRGERGVGFSLTPVVITI